MDRFLLFVVGWCALAPWQFEKDYERMDSESRDLLTVEQAAQYLQLSQSSIRSYIRQGKLNAFRIAGKRKVLIPRTELLKLLEPARVQDLDEDEAAVEVA
jgi:excisionase family DNA binding protein